jgi:hypothetical protein
MNLEHPNYTLVAYKPDGFQICMGCTTSTFGSDFKLFTGMMMDDCLRHHAELRRVTYDDQEPEWEINILYRGNPIGEAGTAIHELYYAALDQEIEDQNEAEAEHAKQALAERDQAAQQLAAMQQEGKVRQLQADAEELGFTLTPKAPA